MKFTYENRRTAISCIQYACSENKEENIEKAISLIHDAVREKAEIICLPELFAHPYFPAHHISKIRAIQLHAETIPGPITKQLSEIAKKARVVIVGGSIYEKGIGEDKGKYFNTAPIIDTNGEIVALHRKAHIPNDPGYTERTYFEHGAKPVTVAKTEKGMVGVGICFDQWFPEVSSIASRKGAEILFYPTAIGDTDEETVGSIEHDNGFWDVKLQNALKGQAAMGNMFIGMANRIGQEGDTKFFGGSSIFNHNGETLKKLGKKSEGIASAECNLGLVQPVKDAWMFHDLRRPEIYNENGF